MMWWRGGRHMNRCGGGPLLLFKTEVVEFQRATVFCDISDKLVRGVLRKLGLNVEGDLNIGSYDAGKMLDDLLCDA